MTKHLIVCLFVFSHSFICSAQAVNAIREQAGIKYAKPEELDDGIRTATLNNVGINENVIRTLEDSIITGVYPNIHSVLILRYNKLAYERYFPGTDVIRGKGFIGFVEHHRDSLHDIRSVNKSVVGAAVMIAIGQGKIKDTHQRVFDFFPEYAKYDTGMKRDITIQHLLNMSAGFEWDEDIPYSDTLNSERRMNYSPDAINFVLGRQMVNIPGTTFKYNGGCTQLLAAIIERTTGMQVDAFTYEYLFKPIGITQYTWVAIKDGKPSAASGLRLRSRDLAKFGLLFLNGGVWNSEQIIPSQLVAQTLRSQISTPYSDSTYHTGYSNQFWLPTEIIEGKEVSWIQCQGNGGQIVVIDKKNDLVLVITAGNYDRSDLRKSSWDIYFDFVYPALVN